MRDDKTAHIYADYDVKPDPSHWPLHLSSILGCLRDLPRGARILDAGCGGGDFAVGLHENGFEVLGIDASASAIAEARKRGFGRFELASIYEDLLQPFAGDPIDAIVCIEVIEHLYSPYTFARRAPKPCRRTG